MGEHEHGGAEGKAEAVAGGGRDDRRSGRDGGNGSGRSGRGIGNRIIQSATGLAIAAAIVLVGGFGYASYAAFGGRVGHVLGNGTAGQAGQARQTGQAGQAGQNGIGPGQSSAGTTSNAAGSTIATKTIHLVALGDSLTHGLGDASGQGYVGDVTAQLRGAGYTVIQSNLGIDGLTSEGLKTEVQKSEVIDLLRSANVVLISIGGNDLNQAAGLPQIHTAQITKARLQFQQNLTVVLDKIRSVNKTATILLVGLYNPYGNIQSSRQQTDAIVETWNADEQALVSKIPGALVVETYDLFALNPTKYLYIDHFHPNEAGYQRIATRVWQDLQPELAK